MDLGQLEVLRALADHGSVTEAAYATGRTPSAVSQQLKALQRSVGTTLVERFGRGVRLTDAGQALAAASLRVGVALAELDAEWADWQQAERGSVRLATFHSAGELLLPGLLRRLGRLSDLSMELVDHDVSTGDFAAATAHCDIVIAHRGDDSIPAGRASVAVHPLFTEPVDVALSSDHPLAGRSGVRAAEVIGERWIGVPEGFPLDRILVGLSVLAGRPAEVVHRSVSFPLAERLVAAGHGVALLPRYATALHRVPGLVLVPVTDVRLRRHVEALVHPERAVRRAVRAVLAELTATAADIAQ
ncbi:LysR family transcriptional regulator [Naumannella sp. ID2617S]|uniref:LysR family transcriptional regulator n=1 Tax=Enemella dayhoffiae TaxID=2016507 RepID=A0A255GLE6_9ACTN|nr:LysR family transcriptional regulator [Enemella dayhoffiae]NNG20462.1 LysR family transcriptional regulator [Naumannella sp. ID2617S]OYO16667.1 LysR family transcriptional regulator [Enemella dayhoffiae]